MGTIKKAAALVILIIMATMMAVERPGEGEQKKKEAIEALDKIDDVVTQGLDFPVWAQSLISTGMTVAAPMLIDLLVKVEGKSGFFAPSAK